MSVLNTVNCDTAGGNTGIGNCFLDLKTIKMVIIAPRNKTYSGADIASASALLLALQADTLAAKKDRVYPVKNLVGLTDNSAEPATETLGFGGIAIVNDGKYDLTMRFIEGGYCLNNALRKFNSSNSSIFLVDDNGQLLGTRVGNTLQGFPLELFYALPPKLSDGSGTVTSYQFRIVFDAKYLADSLGFVKGNFADWQTVNGLQDVILSEAAGSAEPVLKIETKIGCSGDSIFTDFETELEDEALWVATNKTTGATVTITSVAISGGVATVTVDGTDPDYPTTGQVLGLKLTTPALLAADGVDGYESNELLITIV